MGESHSIIMRRDEGQGRRICANGSIYFDCYLTQEDGERVLAKREALETIKGVKSHILLFMISAQQ